MWNFLLTYDGVMHQAAPSQAPAPRRGAYPKGIRRRQEILDRAIEVFAERGAEGTSLRAIGDALGVSHAALRHYFDSREHLLVEVYRAAEARAGAEHPTPEDATVAGRMVHAARFNHGVPGLVQLYSTLVASALEHGHPLARRFVCDRFAALRQDLIARVVADQTAGRIRSDLSPEAVAALVIAASDGLQTQWLLDPAVDMEHALDLLDAVLRPPDPRDLADPSDRPEATPPDR